MEKSPSTVCQNWFEWKSPFLFKPVLTDCGWSFSNFDCCVFFELLWAFYRAIKLIFNSRDLEMAAENVNLVTRPFNLKRTGLYFHFLKNEELILSSGVNISIYAPTIVGEEFCHSREEFWKVSIYHPNCSQKLSQKLQSIMNYSQNRLKFRIKSVHMEFFT